MSLLLALARSTPSSVVTGGLPGIRKRVWIDGEPYDIPVDALPDVERWMPKKAIKKAAKEKRVPKIEVIGRTNDGLEVREEVRLQEWAMVAPVIAEASFLMPGILEFAAFEQARNLIRRRRALTLLLMAA